MAMRIELAAESRQSTKAALSFSFRFTSPRLFSGYTSSATNPKKDSVSRITCPLVPANYGRGYFAPQKIENIARCNASH